MAIVKGTPTPNDEQGVNPISNYQVLSTQALNYKSTITPDDKTKVQYTIISGPTPAVGSMSAQTWTQASVGGSIRYNVDKTNFTQQFIRFRLLVKDLNDNSSIIIDPFTIVYNFKDTPPVVKVGELTVKENSEEKVSKVQIDATDAFDSPFSIFIVPQAWPAHGEMLFKGNPIPPGYKLTMDDILSGFLSYKHNGDDAIEDFFTFKVRDSKNQWTGSQPGKIMDEVNANIFSMKINIIQIDLPLRVTESGPVSINVCEVLPLSIADIMAEDEDDPTLPITFTLDTIPLHNTILKAGSPLGVGGTFTLADVQAGAIAIEQDCSSDLLVDEFYFTASHTKQSVPENRFQINLIPNKPPTVSIVPLEVNKCENGIVTGTNVVIVDPEGKPPQELIIKILTLPVHGTLTLGGGPVAIGTTLTYQQLLDEELVYAHDCTVHVPLTDSVDFSVSDGPNEVFFTLPIIIISPLTKPPYMTANKTQECPRNGDTTWGVADFCFDDDDSADDDVFWECTELGQYGVFEIDKGDGLGFTPVTIGDKFSLDAWLLFQFRYVASAPPNNVMEDHIKFKLYDEIPNVVEDFVLTIKFPAPSPVCPDVTTETLVTTYKTDTPVSELELVATTPDVGPELHKFTLTEVSDFGKVFLGETQLAVGDTWTQVDVNEMKLIYYGDTTTESTDSFKFDVDNGQCVVSGVVNISFIEGLVMVNSGPMDVAIGLEGVANPSVTALITNEYLLWTSGWWPTEPDASEKIQFKLTKAPSKGKLVVDTTDIVVDSFFWQNNINANQLNYVTNDGLSTEDTDSFDYEVTDTYETQTYTFPINLTTVIPEPPIELINNGLTLGELRCANILQANLTVLNYKIPATEVVFEVIETVNHGVLRNGSTLLSDSSTFTLQDILTGKMSYCNTEAGVLLDSFEFNVTIGTTQFTHQLFPITIIPPPPPELKNLGITVDPCVERAITPTRLFVINLRSDFSAADMIYTITAIPQFGSLEKNAVALSVGDTFTQQDIVANVITYQSSTYEEPADSFMFDVESIPFTQTGNTFNITIAIGDNPPWIGVNEPLIIFEGTTDEITLDHLQMCDVDLDADE